MLFVRKATQDLIFDGREVFRDGEILVVERKGGLFFLKSKLGVGGFSSLEELNQFTRELNNFEIATLTEEMQQELLEQETLHKEETEETVETILELEDEMKELAKKRQMHLDEVDYIDNERDGVKEEINFLRSTLDDDNTKEATSYSKQEIARMSFNDLLKNLHS